MKTALITGINGMDGSHLADFLLEKGYEVFGLERRSSTKNRTNTAHLEENEHFHFRGKYCTLLQRHIFYLIYQLVFFKFIE